MRAKNKTKIPQKQNGKWQAKNEKITRRFNLARYRLLTYLPSASTALSLIYSL